MKISQEDAIPIKNLYVKTVWCTKTIVWISRQWLETSKRQSDEQKPQHGYNWKQQTIFVRHVAVEDLVLGEEHKPKGTDQLVKLLRVKLAFPV